MSVKLALIIGLLSVNIVTYAAVVPTAPTGKLIPMDKLKLSVGFSYENSDNIFHSPVNQKAENIIHSLFAANYQKQTAKLNAVFSLNVDHKNYQKHTFTNRTNVSSEFLLGAALQKQRLFWDMHNRLARVQINQALPNIPTNQENTNYFMTGPRFVFFNNNKHSLKADVRYEKFYTQTSRSDYSGYIFDTSYHRNVTRTAAMDLAVKYNNRKFDDESLNSNYKRTDLTLGLSKRTKRAMYGFNVGRTQLNYQNRPDEQAGIFRANYMYELGKQSTLKASYARELSDFSNVFVSTVQGSPTNTNVSGAIFLLKSGKLSVERSFSNVSLTYNFVYTGHEYSSNILDTITRASKISLSNNLSVSTHLRLSAIYRDTSFVAGDRTDVSRIYDIGLIRTFLNAYDLALNLQYDNTGSTNGNFNYDERRITLSGHYYFR